MQTIALVAQKGGTGKTTLAIALAVVASTSGRSTLIIDLDPQASACKWGDRRNSDAPAIIDAQPARLHNALQKAKQAGIELTIIDTPARIEQAAAEAAKLADLILIPSKPSIYDIETINTTFDLVRVRSKRRPIVILNSVPAVGSRGDQAAQVIQEMGLDICPVRIGHRVAFEYASQLGLSVTEFEPEGKAAAEVRELYKSICRTLDVSTP